ncbi:hypothetical protein GQ600_8097 [Phytophthora cactorum]|nr:hypothetical protein GQ600_8097 [Phytophthora cactorum]
MSTVDLAIRVIFAISLLGATGKMKELLQCNTTRSSRVTMDVRPNSINQPASIGPLLTIQQSITKLQNESSTNKVISPSCRLWNKLSADESRRHALIKMTHIMLATWVLALHLEGSLRTPLIECSPRVNL